MRFMLDQIQLAAESGAIFPAVMMALTIPDIAGAVDSGSGVRSNTRYRAWLDSVFFKLHPRYSQHGIDGHCLYGVRCKLLHEALSDPSTSEASKYSEMTQRKRLVAFHCSDTSTFHLITTNFGSESRTLLDGKLFCSEMVAAGRKWLESKVDEPDADALIQAMVDVRMEVPGLSKGVPVIC